MLGISEMGRLLGNGLREGDGVPAIPGILLHHSLIPNVAAKNALDGRDRITEGMEARQGGDGFGSAHDSPAPVGGGARSNFQFEFRLVGEERDLQSAGGDRAI
jgi:hypothetical protein